MTAGQSDLIEAVGQSPIAMVISNPRRADNPLEVVNPAFCDLTGYAEDEIVGNNCRFLAGDRTDAVVTEQIRSAIRGARPIYVDILNYKKSGGAFRNGVMITPLFDDEGALAWFLGSQLDLGPDPGSAFEQRRAQAAARIAALPPRQRQVLSLVARGLLNKQIAWELKISEKTVKMHRSLMLEKLRCGTTAEAIRIAVEGGL